MVKPDKSDLIDFLTSKKTQFSIAVVLTFLVALPIWLIPIAPLPDWVTHLALSHEAYLIYTGQITHQYYFLDFSFLGYSFMYLLLMALQFFVSWELAGKIVLTLLVFSTPICWHYFFKKLDPEKEPLFIVGFLLCIYIWFFYGGMISFLFSIDFGLVFMAIGMTGRNKPLDIVKFFLIGLLTFMANVYGFFLCAVVIFISQFYRLYVEKKRLGETMLLPCIILTILLLLNSLSYTNPARDIGFYKDILKCTGPYQIDLIKNNISSPMMSTLVISFLNPAGVLSLFRTIYLSKELYVALFLLIIGFFVFMLKKTLLEEKAPDIFAYLPIVKFNGLYLALAMILFLHYFIIQDYQIMQTSATLSSRSIPFMFAFLFLAVQCKKMIHPLFYLITIIVIINAFFMASQFMAHAPVQSGILSKTYQLAHEIPNGSAVYVIPASWNSANTSVVGVFVNPYYHSTLLLYNPSLYVSNEFFNPPPSMLHSSFPLFDEFKFDPRLNESAFSCYNRTPKIFGWIINQNMTLRKNS